MAKYTNNAVGVLQNSYTSTDTTIEVSNGGLFGDAFPYPITYEYRDNSGNVIEREIMSVTARTGNSFTVTRASEACPATYLATTLTQTAIPLRKGATIEARVTASTLSNSAFPGFGTTAGTALEGSRDALYAKLPSNNTFTGANTFGNTLRVGNPSAIGGLINIGQAGVGTFRSAFIFQSSLTGDMQIWNQQDARLQFATNNSIGITMDASRNVGIGTTSPTSKLQVVGLPTSSVGLTSGAMWRNGTVVNIVA